MDGTNKMQFTYKMEYYSDLKKETGIFHNMEENVLSEKNNSVLLHLPLVHTAVKNHRCKEQNWGLEKMLKKSSSFVRKILHGVVYHNLKNLHHCQTHTYTQNSV